MSEKNIERLVKLCAYAGERFDLSQAGGGNASFVENGDLCVTASGWSLSDVQDESGICRLDRRKLLKGFDDLLRQRSMLAKGELEKLAGDVVSQARKTESIRPSIETLMHSLLGPFTLHTHPIPVTALLSRRHWREAVRELFPGALTVGYHTPGVELALALADSLTAAGLGPGAELSTSANDSGVPVSGSGVPATGSGVCLVFLENHGLIVAAESIEDVMRATDSVMDAACSWLDIDLSRYKTTNLLSALIRSMSDEPISVYLCEDKILLDALAINPALLLSKPTWPDQLVYCGSEGVRLQSFQDVDALRAFVDRHAHLPRIVVVDGKLFLVERTIRNCRRLEEVLKAHVMMLTNANPDDVRFLSSAEQEYLLNWEAEKARQRMKS